MATIITKRGKDPITEEVKDVHYLVETRSALQADGSEVQIVARDRPVNSAFLQELLDINAAERVELLDAKTQLDVLEAG